MFTRRAFFAALLGASFALTPGLAVGATPIKVGAYLVNTEGAFTSTAQTYAVPLTLAARARLMVQAAPQFAMDFGIIPAADLKKWRSGQSARFLLRLTGVTDTRYITLNAGAYYVVARDLNGGIVPNGFAIKVRRFKGVAVSDGTKLAFVSGQIERGTVLPNNWNGFSFFVPKARRIWFDGLFSRGLDRKVRWEIVTEEEFLKFKSGASHKALLSGADPTRLGFEFTAGSATYYFLVINQAATYSAYTATVERYK